MAQLTGVRAILFDAVGTLMRPEPAVAQVYREIGARFGSRLSVEEIAARFEDAFAEADGLPVGWALAHLDESQVRQGGLKSTLRCVDEPHGGLKSTLQRPPTDQTAERRRWQTIVSAVLHDVPDAPGAPFGALWEHFSLASHWRLFDDVQPTWRALERTGLVIGIASNFDDRLAGVCAVIPPLDRCQNLFWSARVGWPKPSPEFFAAIERELALAPSEILLVGDDYVNDYVGAISAGWRAVLLCRGERRGTENEIGSLLELV